MNIKFITKVLVLVVMLSSQSYGFMGFGSNNIDIVKKGRLQYNENITLEEVFDNLKGCESIKWYEDKHRQTGDDLVVIKCNLDKNIKEKLNFYGDLYANYYFLIDGDEFEFFGSWTFVNGRSQQTSGIEMRGTRDATLQKLYNGEL